MLVNNKALLEDAERYNYAVAGINTTSLTMLRAVIEAAEELNMPVILSHAQLHEPYAPIDLMAPLMKKAAEEAKVPCSLHLDHGVSEKYILKAVRNGFTSIMVDFARCPFEENIARTKAMTDLCHELDISVEGEFGEMPSNVKGQGRPLPEGKTIDYFYTDPDKAKEFVERTGIDNMVVSFGSVHGIYIENPVMDFERLKKIREKLPGFPLVMHGGSGLSQEDTKKCINGGVRKINYYTYMATAPSKLLPKYLAQAKTPPYFHEIAEYSKEIMKKQAMYAIALFMNK